MVLILCGRGRDLLQIVLAEDAGPPPLHLLKIVPAAHIPHEDQALDRLHIGAGGDHVHSNGDPGVIAVAETAEGPLRVLGRVGDLLAELVSLAELLPDDLDDVVGVAVRLGKDQRLGDFAPAGKQLGEQILPERADHRADLTGVDDVPVQLGGPVVHILVHLLPPLFPGKPVAVFDHLLHDVGAALGHLGLNEEDVLPHINSVDDGLLSGIFADYILVEEGKGALVRCGSQSNQESVKIIQHLLPHIVDRAVTLVDDDTVEKFRRIFLVVDHLFGGLAVRCGQFVKRSLLRRLVQLLPFQDGIHPLDGTDAHLHIVWQVRVLQPPHTVELGERSVVVIRPIGQKFPLRLLSQALGIHQEQHPVDLGIFQQTINCGDGGKRLACAGGHLNKRSGTVLTEGLLQIMDGRDLAIPEPGGVQGWKTLHIVADGVILF